MEPFCIPVLHRSWAYSVEIGAHHLAANGILNPAAPDIGRMMDYLEEQQFLRFGMGDYPESKNRQNPFQIGGFAKVQPYYGRFAEVYARRDDIKPFIRSYFNAIPTVSVHFKHKETKFLSLELLVPNHHIVLALNGMAP